MIKITGALLLCVGWYGLLCAQAGLSDTAFIRQLKTAARDHSQVAMIAHQLTDVCGPRLTNSPGYNRAINWVSKTFKEWKLSHAGPEEWGKFGKGWTVERSYLAMKNPYYMPIIAYPQAWTKSTRGPLTVPVMLLDNLDSVSINKMGNAIKGKIIIRKTQNASLVNPFQPYTSRFPDSVLNTLPESGMMTRQEVDGYAAAVKRNYYTKRYLESKGAVALLSSAADSRDGTIYSMGAPAYTGKYAPSLPEMSIARESLLQIERLLEDKIPVTLEIEVQNKWYENETGYNVVGEIAGTDPLLKDQVVMLGGHLDSWHPATGATDNAAGCAVMMEAVRLLTTLGIHPRRTIRIALWGGEEQGPYGSIGYVKKHFADPLDMKLKPAHQNISAYYNLDNGSGKIRGIYLQNNEQVRDIFTAWLAPFADMGATGITSSNTGSTDHISFDAVGIPGFQFIQDPLEYENRTHHSNVDTYDHLFIEDMKQAAVIVAFFVYNTAMRDELLPRKPLPKPGRYIYEADFPW